jgi:hypothetical protein
MWERSPELADRLIELAQQITRWTISSPQGMYTLTNKFTIAGIDFMVAEPIKQQGVGVRHHLRTLPKGSKKLYNPDTKVWFRLKVWHSGDTLSIITDGNCFYFMGKWPGGMSYMTFVDALSKYVIMDLDLTIKLREQTNEGLEKADGWEDV